MNGKSKQIIARILVVAFAFYYANICFFYHSHIINGVTIVHSHLHDKNHAQTGTHTDSELKLISALSTFESLLTGFTIIGIGMFFLCQTFVYSFFNKNIVSRSKTSLSLRGPPQ